MPAGLTGATSVTAHTVRPAMRGRVPVWRAGGHPPAFDPFRIAECLRRGGEPSYVVGARSVPA